MGRPQLPVRRPKGGSSLLQSAHNPRKHVRASTVLLALALMATGCIQQAEAGSPRTLRQYPLVGGHNPRMDFLKSKYRDAKVAAILARYDSMVANASVIRASNLPILRQVFQLNPGFVLTLQWGIIETGQCGSVASQRAKLREHLSQNLGPFRRKLSGIQVDGAGNLSQCSNGVTKVKDALRSYRNILTNLGMSDAVLTVNGAHFPTNVSGCGYNAARDGFGAYGFAGLEKLVSGVLKEAWTDRPRWINNTAPNIGGLLDEVCAWHRQSVDPTVVFGLAQSCTPWWFLNSSTGCKWKKARLAFAAAQMYNRTVHMHLPAAQDPNNRANKSHLYWLDYYAVNLQSNRPPSHGSGIKEPGDDGLGGQRSYGGYLGPPVAAGKRFNSGGAMVREFKCGYVIANWSTQTGVYTPPVETQMISGRQDPAYDRGTSWRSYAIPPKDGRVLIKKFSAPAEPCLAPTVHDLMDSGTWRPGK